MGSPDISCASLQALLEAGHCVQAVVTQPDKKAGRGRKLTSCAVAEEADACGLNVIKPVHIRQSYDELARLKADACVVIAYGQILPQAVLDAFPLGCINLHTSLLPLLRGASPINQAIMQGFKQTGVTTMYMDRGMDTGDIIYQEAIAIDAQETAGGLAEKLAELGAELLVRTLKAMAEGAAPRRPQDHVAASYAPLLSKQDGLIDWRRPARELDWLVRGTDPWPAAHTFLEGKMMRLFAPTALGQAPAGVKPGQVVPAPQGSEDYLWVACGDGRALGLGTLQAAGKRRMSAGDYLRGAKLAPGSILGA